MPDGAEEREERKARLEQQKRENRPDPRLDTDEAIDWQPERPDS